MSATVQDSAPKPGPDSGQDARPGEHVGRDLALYTGARLGLVAVVAAVLVLASGQRIPLIVSVAVAVVVALPLSMLVFRGLNQRVTAGLAARGAQRRAERDRLRAQLRGEVAEQGDEPGSDDR